MDDRGRKGIGGRGKGGLFFPKLKLFGVRGDDVRGDGMEEGHARREHSR